MGSAAEHRFLGESTHHLAGGVKLGEGSKGRVGAAVAIGEYHAGQMDAHGGHVVRTYLQVAETKKTTGLARFLEPIAYNKFRCGEPDCQNIQARIDVAMKGQETGAVELSPHCLSLLRGKPKLRPKRRRFSS